MAPRTEAATYGNHVSSWTLLAAMDSRIQACEKTSRLRENSAVMAALDAAIHGKHRTFNMLLDGRVKCGHDNGGSGA
jgi:hypothetical protein